MMRSWVYKRRDSDLEAKYRLMGVNLLIYFIERARRDFRLQIRVEG